MISMIAKVTSRRTRDLVSCTRPEEPYSWLGHASAYRRQRPFVYLHRDETALDRHGSSVCPIFVLHDSNLRHDAQGNRINSALIIDIWSVSLTAETNEKLKCRRLVCPSGRCQPCCFGCWAPSRPIGWHCNAFGSWRTLTLLEISLFTDRQSLI